MMETDDLRLAEVVAALSLAADVWGGAPLENGLRGAIAAARLAEAAGLDEQQGQDAYYLAMLRTIGCSCDVDAMTDVLGSEVGRWASHLSNGTQLQALKAIVDNVGRGESAGGRVGKVARALIALPGIASAARAHCEVGQLLAQGLNLGPGVVTGMGQILERWDGGGRPAGLREDALTPAVCVAQVAADFQLVYGQQGRQAALAMVRARSDRSYSPAVAGALLRHAATVLADQDLPSIWETTLAAEPGRPLRVAGPARDRAVRTLGEFADMKSVYFRGHSAGVAALAGRVARRLRMRASDITVLQHAGHLHDIGRVAVPAAIWNKAGRLTEAEFEQVRMHAYATGRILERAPSLGAAAAVAALTHERLDGRGYPRGLAADALPVISRILAAANVAQALREPRPHRPALAAELANEVLLDEVRSGRLDRLVVDAIIGSSEATASPAASRPRPSTPSGLTARETDVLRLLARGLTDKQIAEAFGLSPRTVRHHVEHVYAKIGVSTRVAAALFAMQNDVLAADGDARDSEARPRAGLERSIL